MSKKYIIDASALLIVIYNENSKFDCKQYFADSVIHLVNVSEVLTVLMRDGMPINIARQIVHATVPELVASNLEEASLAAEIRVKNKEYGISTGDSFCLASAKLNDFVVITADQVWTKLDLGLEIICVR